MAEVDIVGLGPIEVPDEAAEDEESLQQALQSKFKEFQNFVDTVFQGLEPEEKASLFTAPIPLVGDAVGLYADAMQYIEDPESRTLANGLLTAASVAPVVPNTRAVEGATKVSQNLRNLFHGTDRPFLNFKEGPVFVTPDPTVAEEFARKGERAGLTDRQPRIDKVEVRADKIFDPENMTPEQVEDLRGFLKERVPEVSDTALDKLFKNLREGSFTTIEDSRIQDFIRSRGFDAFFVREGPASAGGVRNLGVLDPSKIKKTGSIELKPETVSPE